MLEAGTLNQRITFQVRTKPDTLDTLGAPEPEWPTAFRNPQWAAFQPVGSREFPSSHKRHEQTTARFIVRFSNELEAIETSGEKYRISYRGKIWDIFPPLPLGRNHREYYEIEAYTVQ